MTALIQCELSAQKLPSGMPRSAARMRAQSRWIARPGARVARRGARIARPRAVLLDALGTLLTFDPPAGHLRDELRARLGVDVGAAAAEAAVRAEIAYYRAHLH